MRIVNNIMAMNAHRQLMVNQGGVARSIERLSSGLRINRAGDDAAGLAISEKMRGQIRGLNQASRNAQDAISLIQSTEGALNETHAILQRMRELAVQAATATNTEDDRKEIQKEINDLTSEINRIGNTTEFNTMKLLEGSRANTLAVTGMNFVGGTETAADVGGTGLDVTLTAANALAAGTHTLDIEVERNTRNVQELTPLTSDFTGGTGVGKGVVFAGDVITDAHGAAEDWTLTYDGDGIFTLTNATNTVEDQIRVGEEYNNHGLTFTIEDVGTIGIGEDLKFSTIAGGGAIGTDEVGWVAGTAKDAVFNGPITLTDQQELSWAAGGTVRITLDGSAASGAGEAKIEIIAADGVTVLANDVFEGLGVYDQHGISFEITNYGATNGTDVIEIAISEDTYTVTASLDGGAAVDVITDYDGTSNDAVNNFAGIAGLTLDSSDVLTAGSFTFEVEQTVDGEDNSLAFQIGANENQAMRIAINDMRSVALGISSTTGGGGYASDMGVTDGTQADLEEYGLDMSTHESAAAAVSTIDEAIAKVSAERSKLGASQNRLEHTIANLGTLAENLQAAESRIRDVDMAAEMMQFTKFQILQQASTAMLAQANLAPQSVLQLLG